MKKIFILLLLGTTLNSCVSSKIHKDLQSKYDETLSEKMNLEEENSSLSAKLIETEDKLQTAKTQLTKLKDENEILKRRYSALEKEHKVLNDSYELLTQSSNSMLAKNATKNLELLRDLESSRALLEEENIKLKEKEQKIAELEYLMRERESVLAQMKNSLSEALRGFEGKGLTVEQKNGKVYVSLENRLLFASGKWEVNTDGKKAINELAKVLSTQDGINVLIEGHTDADAYRGNSVLVDNWDLSVKRSTAIVRIILTNKGIDPKQITAAGRSKFLPVDTNKTSAGKSKNRRIEVIIEPDLSKIEAMLNQL